MIKKILFMILLLNQKNVKIINKFHFANCYLYPFDKGNSFVLIDTLWNEYVFEELKNYNIKKGSIKINFF